MHIKSVEFAGAIGQPRQRIPESAIGRPQVAFCGRSNVGKSSLINRLLGRTRTAIARVSGEPGKTQEINFYQVQTDLGEFFLVDLPGYGYARVPKSVREKFAPLIAPFLAESPELAGVVQLIDLRHGPSEDDLQSVETLAAIGRPTLFVLTKLDKLKRSQQAEAIRKAVTQLGITPDQALPFSALNGEGREDLLESIASLVFPAPEEGDSPLTESDR
ncbi:ribosome biogenesis GTP-binding protein YihA/YsxC [soil metagenome]